MQALCVIDQSWHEEVGSTENDQNNANMHTNMRTAESISIGKRSQKLDILGHLEIPAMTNGHPN